MGRIAPPWYRQNRFYLGCLVFLVCYFIFILPHGDSAFLIRQRISIAVFILVSLATLSWFISDKFQPEWLKTSSVLILFSAFGWIFYKFSGADWSSFFRLFLNFEKMNGHYASFIKPTLLILKMAGFSCVYAVLIGAFFAVFRSFDNIVVNWLISVYVTFFRSFPAMVLLVLIYYALPSVGIKLSSVDAVIVGLSLFYSAYTTEVFRAGVESIHRTQIESASVLGLSVWQTIHLVIFPQAVRIVIPPLTSQLIGVLKTTSISYVVGVVDLITRARQLQSYLMVVTPLLVVSFIYLAIILPFVFLSGYLEKRSSRWSNSAQH